jgi:arylsulfatase A-like enzyme
MSHKKLAARIVSAMVCIVSLCAAGLSGAEGDTVPVILISIDTLRADHLGCYGYEKPTSPAIDDVASGSVLFTRAYAQSNFTPPSHASMLTSLYVTSHGLKRWGRLSPDVTTIAEVLAGAGYSTGGFASLPFFSEHGFGQGFSTKREIGGRRKRGINKAVIEWIEKLPSGKKFFLFIHYYHLHRPYEPQAPFDTLFTGQYDGIFSKGTVEVQDIWKHRVKLGEEDIRYLDGLYDGQIRELDTVIKELFDFLKAEGIYDRALIVITSDHGEMMGYHPNDYFKYTHDPVLYDGVIRVPLIIKLPSGLYGGTRIDGLAESVDIVPTILKVLYPDRDLTKTFQGKDLMRAIRAQDRTAPLKEFAVSETYGWVKRRCIVTGSLKYIYDIETGHQELYDLADDPLELRNRMGEEREEGRALHKLMEDFFAALPHAREEDGETLSKEYRKRLKSLGYLQ